MRLIAAVLLLAVLISGTSASVFKAADYTRLFTQFVKNFSRSYTAALMKSKLEIFKANLDKITLKNTKSPGFLRVNDLADVSPAEYRAMLGARAPASAVAAVRQIVGGANRNGRNSAIALLQAESDVNAPLNEEAVAAAEQYATSFLEQEQEQEVDAETQAQNEELLKWADTGFDWRTKNVLGPAKKQGACGSCWSFGTIAAVESGVVINKKVAPVVLSEQNLIDCDLTNGGCNGGWYINSFKHIVSNGVRTEKAYGGYKARRTACRNKNVPAYEHRPTGATNVFDYTVTKSKEAYQFNMIAALKKGPVATGIYASDDLQFWGDKVYFHANCGDWKEVNHAVVAVGVGKNSDGTRYWIIRNSWGPKWGDGTGHFKLERHPTENTCSFFTGAFQANF